MLLYDKITIFLIFTEKNPLKVPYSGFDREPQRFYNKNIFYELLAFFHNDHIARLKDVFCQYELKN